MYLGLSLAFLAVGVATDGLIAALSQLIAFLLVLYATITRMRAGGR